MEMIFVEVIGSWRMVLVVFGIGLVAGLLLGASISALVLLRKMDYLLDVCETYLDMMRHGDKIGGHSE